MEILKTQFIQGFMRMCSDGYKLGWHERNGGNLTYRIKVGEIALIREGLDETTEDYPIGTSVPALANEYFLVTGSGKFFRNVDIDPLDSIGIIKIDTRGENYKICWGLINGGKPTSELPSHLFTRELWEMATECPVVFPDGVGVVPWMVPGGRDIAIATSELMKKYDVAIWAHHGIFCAGSDFDITFGLAHTVEKSAAILVKMLSMSSTKLQTISPANFRLLAKDFNVVLPEKFLFDK